MVTITLKVLCDGVSYRSERVWYRSSVVRTSGQAPCQVRTIPCFPTTSLSSRTTTSCPHPGSGNVGWQGCAQVSFRCALRSSNYSFLSFQERLAVPRLCLSFEDLAQSIAVATVAAAAEWHAYWIWINSARNSQSWTSLSMGAAKIPLGAHTLQGTPLAIDQAATKLNSEEVWD